MAMCIFRQ